MDYIEFGKIVSTHGLKGEVKVYSYTDNETNILKLKKVYIENIPYTVENIRFSKNLFILKLKEINSIEQTEKLINKECLREVRQNESNEQDGYFVRDLIGIDVLSEDGKTLGVLKEVFNTGANDVYAILKENGKEIYLPAISDVIKSIDINSKKMIVKIMEGLE